MAAHSSAISRVRDFLTDQQPSLDGFFVTKPESRAYLSGFTGSFGYLLITLTDTILFTDGRYTEQAAAQAPDWTIVRLYRPYENAVVPEIDRLGVKNIGIEAENMTVADFNFWQSKLLDAKLVPTNNVVANLRRLKTPEELANIRKAVEIADNAFAYILNIIRVGITEREVALELENAMKRGGADSIAFDTIVVSGARGALPHGKPSTKAIEAGDFVTIDFGARYNGYNSDVTRTVFVGGGIKQPTDRQREVYDLVLKNQLAGIAAVKPGVVCSAVDRLSRDIFAEAGQLDYFLHSLGHSLGREVHEYPMLTPPDDSIIEVGMVLTVEPGLYYSDWGGVRIEDDVYVTENGAEVLPRSTKELILL